MGCTGRVSTSVLPSPGSYSVGTAVVLEKIDQYGLRDVIRQDLPPTAARLAEIIHRGEAGECLEVANQVRLVEIAALDGDPRPVRLFDVSHEASRILKTSHAAIHLRRQADFCRKHLDKSSLAEANATRHIANHGIPGRS